MARTYTRGSIVERLWSKIDRRGPDDCWLFTGAYSRGKGRESCYGCLREGGAGSRIWRVNRLVLILKTAPTEAPRDDGEDLIAWLWRANRWYSNVDSSHTCDVSLCCNPAHLEWLPHSRNISEQTTRRRARRQAAA